MYVCMHISLSLYIYIYTHTHTYTYHTYIYDIMNPLRPAARASPCTATCGAWKSASSRAGAGGHTERPHPQKSDLIFLDCSE